MKHLSCTYIGGFFVPPPKSISKASAARGREFIAAQICWQNYAITVIQIETLHELIVIACGTGNIHCSSRRGYASRDGTPRLDRDISTSGNLLVLVPSGSNFQRFVRSFVFKNQNSKRKQSRKWKMENEILYVRLCTGGGSRV